MRLSRRQYLSLVLLPLLWPLGVLVHGLLSVPGPMAPGKTPASPAQTPPSAAPFYSHELIFQPVPEFVRFHAATLTECANGDLLAACRGDRPGSSRSSWDLSAAILLTRKAKGATAWTPPTAISMTPGRMDTNPVLWSDPVFGGPEGKGGRVWLFHGTSFGVGWQYSRVSFCYSDDYGQTWSLRQPINGVENLNTRCPPVSVRTPQGRNIVLPVYREYGMASCLISSDNGVTWQSSERMISGIVGNFQPSLIQRPDGSLVAYMRASGTARVLAAESLDGGWHWRPVEKLALINPFTSVAAAQRGNAGNTVALGYNNTPNPDRRNLTVALSTDGGLSFSASRVITPPEAAEQDAEYPAVLMHSDGSIQVAYTLSRSAIALDICNEAWLQQGGEFSPPVGSTGPGWQGLPGLAAFLVFLLAGAVVTGVIKRVGRAAGVDACSRAGRLWILSGETLLVVLLLLLASRGANGLDTAVLAMDDFLAAIRAITVVAWFGLVLLAWFFLVRLPAQGAGNSRRWGGLGWLTLLAGPVLLGTILAWIILLPPTDPTFGQVERVDPWVGSGKKAEEIQSLRGMFQTQYRWLEAKALLAKASASEPHSITGLAFVQDRSSLISQFAQQSSITEEQAESLSPYWTGERFIRAPALQRMRPTVTAAIAALAVCWVFAAVCFLVQWRRRSGEGVPETPGSATPVSPPVR